MEPARREAARRFLLESARPLEAAWFRRSFEGGDDRAVLDALGAFANEDGGFGHGIEPDLRSPSSSPFSTSVAFQHLRRLGLGADHPMVRAGLGYLAATYDADAAGWPITPADAEEHPHAPWWKGKTGTDPANLNPRAELLGVLLEHRDAVDPQVRAEVDAGVARRLGALEGPLEMHELLCVKRLAETPGLEEPRRAALRVILLRSAEACVGRDEEAWRGYGLRPLEVAPAPDALLASEWAEVTEGYLDFLLATQEEDGTWAPAWSWESDFPEAWADAKREWTGVLTLKHLEVLRAYDRL